MNKRTFLITSASLAAVLCAVGTGLPAAADTPKELRIGYQKIGALLILKDQGLLEKRLAAQGIAVKWVQFQSGPPLIEALNAGAIDFGYTGDTPPIFAQASGVNFVYVASMPVPGKSNAILVRENSGIKTIADLRGKKIAFVKGSSAHNVVVQTLEKAHIAWSDITPVYLQPADAGAAIQSGAVDAWSIWDPFYAGAQAAGAKIITDGTGLMLNRAYYSSIRDFASQHPDALNAAIDVINEQEAWEAKHIEETAADISPSIGLPEATLKTWFARQKYGVNKMTPEIFAGQQKIADAFFALGLIPQKIEVSSAAWTA